MADIVDIKNKSVIKDGTCEEVLKLATEVKFRQVLVLGWTDDDQLYFGSSDVEFPTVNWLLDIGKDWLLDQTRSYE